MFIILTRNAADNWIPEVWIQSDDITHLSQTRSETNVITTHVNLRNGSVIYVKESFNEILRQFPQ